MSDNGNNDDEHVDFDDDGRGDESEHDNFSEDQSTSNNYRESDTFDNENQVNIDGSDEKVIKPRTDGGVGVSVNGYIPNVIFISRFAPHIGGSDIDEFMRKFGAITEIKIKGSIGFVEFERAEDAAVAKETCHMQPGLGAPFLVVDFKRDEYIPKQRRGYDNRGRGGRSGPNHQDGRDRSNYNRGSFDRGYDNNYDNFNNNSRGDFGGRGAGRGSFRNAHGYDQNFDEEQSYHNRPPPVEHYQHGGHPRHQPQPSYRDEVVDYPPSAPQRIPPPRQAAPLDGPGVDSFRGGGRGRGRGGDYYPSNTRGERGGPPSRPYIQDDRGYSHPPPAGPQYHPESYDEPIPPVPSQYPHQQGGGGRGDYRGRGEGRGSYQNRDGRGGRGSRGDYTQPPAQSFPPLQTSRQPYGGVASSRGGSHDDDYYPPQAPHHQNSNNFRGPRSTDGQYYPPEHPPHSGGRGGNGYHQPAAGPPPQYNQPGRGGGGRYSNPQHQGRGGGGYHEDARPYKTGRYEEYYPPQQQQHAPPLRTGTSIQDAYSTSNRLPPRDHQLQQQQPQQHYDQQQYSGHQQQQQPYRGNGNKYNETPAVGGQEGPVGIKRGRQQYDDNDIIPAADRQ